MMRVNQSNNNAFTQTTQNRNTRTNSNMQSFSGVMSRISGEQQPGQNIPQQQNTMQRTGIFSNPFGSNMNSLTESAL